MNRLNRKVEYALMALKFLALKEPSELISAKEISDRLGLPFDATAKVLQSLAQGKILRVVQGAAGGYAIAADLARVSFHQLLEIVEGPIEIARCLHSQEGCELLGLCNIQSPMAALNQRLEQFYRELSLLDLLQIGAPATELRMSL